MAIHPDKHIFNPSGCLRLESLQKYMKGEFPEYVREEISLHLEECPFCKEAMEGLTLVPDTDVQNKSISTIREGMKERIRSRKMSTSKSYRLKRKLNWLAAAASIILLTGIFSIYNYLLKPDSEYLAEEVNVTDISEDFTDSIPAAVVSESVASSPLAEFVVADDEMDVIARAEKAEEISSEIVKVGGVSAQKVTAAANTRSEMKYAPVSLKKTKGTAEPAANKINRTKPVFQNNVYKDFYDYIEKNLIYPDSALTADLPGRVILEFTIDENGIISELKVRESSHNIFEEEARRLISSSGIWQPATENGQPVSYLMFLPIDFIPPDKK